MGPAPVSTAVDYLKAMMCLALFSERLCFADDSFFGKLKKTLGDRAFSSAAPNLRNLWYSLPMKYE